MALIQNVNISESLLYSELVSRINNSALTPGHYYKITDYRTIYIQPVTNIVLGGSGSSIPSKPFELIVLALTANELDQNAIAVSNADFPNADKWKVKYDVNIPYDNVQFAAIDWPSVTQVVADNIGNVLAGAWGDETTLGYTPLQVQAYIDGTFATNNFGGDVFLAEQNIYQNYNIFNNPAFPFYEPLPVTTTSSPVYNLKYAWADVTSRGVIYELTDDKGNTCAYDFKNIKFIRYTSVGYTGGKIWLNSALRFEYYASGNANANPSSSESRYTYQLGSGKDGSEDVSNGYNITNNVIREAIVKAYNPTLNIYTSTRILNNIVFYPGQINNNSFGVNCINSTINYAFQNNEIGSGFEDNKINYSFENNVIDNGFKSNYINTGFSFNRISALCTGNTLGTNFKENEIGTSFQNNVLGNDSSSNTIGNNCKNNTISQLQSNTIGHYFGTNTGTNVGANTIGNNCSSNTLGPNFGNNTLGSFFSGNTISGEFSYNQSGSGCSSNIFGITQYNVFGPGFGVNRFGDNCSRNVFGPEFRSNVFGQLVAYNVFESNINNCNITTGLAATNGFTRCIFRSGVRYLTFQDIKFGGVDFKAGEIVTFGPASQFYTYAAEVNPGMPNSYYIQSTVVKRQDGTLIMQFTKNDGTLQMVPLP